MSINKIIKVVNSLSIGKNIRYLRKQAHLTQKQLATMIGVNEVTIRCYESEKYEPKMDNIYKLVTALNCNINEILDHPFPTPTFSLEELEDLGNGARIVSYAPQSIKEALKKENFLSMEERLNSAYLQLNKQGKQKAVEQVEMLTKIPEYRKEQEKPPEE